MGPSSKLPAAEKAIRVKKIQMERRELAAPAVRTAVAKALRVKRKPCHHLNFTANLFPIAQLT